MDAHQSQRRGLCQYHDPDDWFASTAKGRHAAARICLNCPIIVECAQKALSYRATDGVFAGVSLPNISDGKGLKAADNQLRAVIDRYSNMPPEAQLRSELIREAIRYATTVTGKKLSLSASQDEDGLVA